MEWWEGFFTGPWLDVQRAMAAEGDTAEQVDRIERALGLSPPARVLDVPCGEGRVSLELALRGYDVTGIDLTEPFLGDARRKAEELGLDISFQQADMRELALEAAFDAAVCFWGSFGYFDPEGDRRFAGAVARALAPGGRFLIDTISAETILPDFAERHWFEAGGIYVLLETRFDHENGRVETDWTFVGEGRKPETHHSSMRLYSFHELSELLAGVGFARCEGFDSTTLEPFGLGAERLGLVATKG